MDALQELISFIENNQERFYKIAYAHVKNRDDALDIVHNAIVKALQSYHSLRNSKYAHTWFYRILINESLMLLRKNKRIISLEELPPPQLASSLSSDGVMPDRYIDLYAAIDRLPPNLKTIIILRFFEDMKFDTIAEITSVNLSTVKSRLRRALALLKLDMEVLDND